MKDIRRPYLWLFASIIFAMAGYVQGLSIHERLLPLIEKRHPGIDRIVFSGAESIFLISCGVGAVIFTLFFLRELRAIPRARRFYLAGVMLVLVAGSLDYFPEQVWHKVIPYGTEELAEHFAGISFTVAFLSYALNRGKIALARWLGAIRA